jgi:hypothetical protein
MPLTLVIIWLCMAAAAAAAAASGDTRKIFIEFLERSCTAEFSGFLLYKELGRRLKATNPVVAGQWRRRQSNGLLSFNQLIVDFFCHEFSTVQWRGLSSGMVVFCDLVLEEQGLFDRCAVDGLRTQLEALCSCQICGQALLFV